MLQSVKTLGGAAKPSGDLHLRLIKPSGPIHTPTLGQIYHHGFPRAGLHPEILAYRKLNYRRLIKPAAQMRAAQAIGIGHYVSRLYNTLIRPLAAEGLVRELYLDWKRRGADMLMSFPSFLLEHGVRCDHLFFGLASMRVVTTAGVNALVDSLQNTFEPENFKFHGYGTGTTAEAVGDTALVTELTTEYATDNTRPTGSQTEGAGANVYRTVATLSPDGSGTLAITEQMILSQAATGGGTGLDRSVFAAQNLTRSVDSLQTTYDFTISSGG